MFISDSLELIVIAIIIIGVIGILVRIKRSDNSKHIEDSKYFQTQRRFEDKATEDSLPEEDPETIFPETKLQEEDSTFNIENQMEYVTRASFSLKAVMNKSEYKVYTILRDEVKGKGLLYPKVSMGEYMKSDNDNARKSVNSKRVDFIVTAFNGVPILAVEYQGRGHYKSNAAERDAVKSIALKKAGVALVEVFETDSEEDIIIKIRKHFPFPQRGAMSNQRTNTSISVH